MKKKIMLSFIIMLMPLVVNAKNITKEDLKDSIEYMIACDIDGNYTELPYGTDTTEFGSEPSWILHKCNAEMDYTGVETEYEITDDTITYYGVTYNYSIENDGSVIFTMSKEITNGPGAYNKYFSFDDGYALLDGYNMVAKVYGIEPYEAEAYVYDLLEQSDFYTYNYFDWGKSYGEYILLEDETNYNGNLTVVTKNNFDNYAMEIARAIGGSETRTMDDKDNLKTISMTFDPDTSEPDKYKVSYTVKVTPTNDFLGIKNYIEGSIIDDDSSNNSLPPEEVKEETSEEVKKDTSTTENPKTGLFLNIVGIIAILTIGIVIALKNKSAFKKV